MVVDLIEKWKIFLTWVSGVDGGDRKSSPVVSNGPKTTCTVANQQMLPLFTFLFGCASSCVAVCLFLHVRGAGGRANRGFC